MVPDLANLASWLHSGSSDSYEDYKMPSIATCVSCSKQYEKYKVKIIPLLGSRNVPLYFPRTVSRPG